jgi:hypothetical protein
MYKSGIAIGRAFVMYRPYVLFNTLGTILLVAGLIPFTRYLYFFTFENAHGVHHLQSLIAGGVFLTGAFIAYTLGIIADLIRINRTLVEDSLEHAKHQRFDK